MLKRRGDRLSRPIRWNLKKIKWRMPLPGRAWPRPIRKWDLRNAPAAPKPGRSCDFISRINAISSEIYVSCECNGYNNTNGFGLIFHLREFVSSLFFPLFRSRPFRMIYKLFIHGSKNWYQLIFLWMLQRCRDTDLENHIYLTFQYILVAFSYSIVILKSTYWT